MTNEVEVLMTAQDALRKIGKLRRINTDNGAMPAESETASRLQKTLMKRYAIKAHDIPDASPTTVSRLSWIYWQELLEEFSLSLNHFGHRGSAEVGNNSKVYIRLDKSQWWSEERCRGGWKTTARGSSVESLRKYLKEHAPKSYSLLRR
ncbi:MAG: hypothetical protein ACLPPV_13560 [Candidatus Korobacteraceae bacterium]|jgi:hypothetical protein